MKAHVELKLDGKPKRIEFDMPEGAVRPAELLPVLRQFSNAMVEAAEAAATEPIECTKGCGACCRQLVPLAPSLRERVTRLDEQVRLPPAIVCSAGEALLGVELQKLASRLDHQWTASNGESWNRHRAEYLDRRATLDRLAAIEAPTADELFRRAALVETLTGSDEALSLYRSAADQGHPAAGLAAGRLLLDRMDSKGVALVEASMDRDDSLVPEGCRVLAEYYQATRQELAARKCEWRATRHTTRARLADQRLAD